jgi:hypothetical protein
MPSKRHRLKRSFSEGGVPLIGRSPKHHLQAELTRHSRDHKACVDPGTIPNPNILCLHMLFTLCSIDFELRFTLPRSDPFDKKKPRRRAVPGLFKVTSAVVFLPD